MYYIYHIPGQKIGVTRNLKARVEKAQGFKPGEYEVIDSSEDINYISKKELQLQRAKGYKVDRQLYKDLIKLKSTKMKLNVTTQTTTFPCPKQKVKGILMDNIGTTWQTELGEFKLTTEAANWIEANCLPSMFNNERCFIYNKAFYEAFIDPTHTPVAEEESENVYDLIRFWAAEKGIYAKGDSKTQQLKLLEEVGELAKALLSKDREETIDAIGDCVVVLTNLAKLEDLKIEDCVVSAYDVIKNRKGKMINGTFVKEA